MALPISYNIRNVRVRWQVTLLGISGIALVVAVMAVLLSMSAGFQKALRSTGHPDNALIVQRGSASELTSGVRIDDRNTILSDDRIARRADGSAMASWEWVVVMSLPKVDNGGPTNVTLRAVTPQAFEVRGGIKLVEGKSFQPGLDEVIVGSKIVGRVEGLKVGQVVKYLDKRFTVVGVFGSQGGAFESEIWGDFDVMGAMFQRGAGSNSVVVRMKDASQIPALDKWIRAQPQMQLQAVPETKYYSDQAGQLATILKALAAFVAFVMGVGAVFGAMNTMYAIDASRTREIGTLRALGFSRFSILSSFVMESVFLATLAGVIGCLLAWPMNGFSTGTAQTQSFSEVAFAFQLNPTILGTGMVFAAMMGLVGGLLLAKERRFQGADPRTDYPRRATSPRGLQRARWSRPPVPLSTPAARRPGKSRSFRLRSRRQRMRIRATDRLPRLPQIRRETVVEHRDRQGHTISKGQLINNRFVVDRKLGEGGFGEVFLVHDRSTDQICALKLLRPELAAHGALQENFRAEAAIWMGFERHPNIVSVRSVDLFNGCLFIALEFVPAGEIGDNCLDKVLRRRTISVPTTTRWGIELCDALIHAGSKGMIAHRDLKPSNLMIDPGGQLKLTDFGLALSVLSPASRGKEASPSGTLPYMPPEQFRPVAVIDQRSDVYSFGLVLFEICAGGHLPFQIGQPDPRNLVEYFYRLHSTYELPGLDTPLYPVIARCLRKAPSQRYQSFGEVRRDLLVLFQQVTGTGFVPVSKEQMNASEHNNYAVSYDMIGDVKRAMKHIDLAIQAAPHYSPSHNNKAAFLAAQGRVEEALAIWNKLTAEHPELGRPFYNLGNNSMRLGRLSEAVSLFREAMKREPDWVPAIVNTAIAYQQMRDGPSAIEFYNRAIALSPGEAQIRYNYGFCLYELGDYNGALSMLTQAAELNPHHLSTLNYLGLCHMELSMFREAVACFDRAIRIDPQYKHALDNRSRVLNVIGHKKGLLGRLFGKR